MKATLQIGALALALIAPAASPTTTIRGCHPLNFDRRLTHAHNLDLAQWYGYMQSIHAVASVTIERLASYDRSPQSPWCDLAIFRLSVERSWRREAPKQMIVLMRDADYGEEMQLVYLKRRIDTKLMLGRVVPSIYVDRHLELLHNSLYEGYFHPETSAHEINKRRWPNNKLQRTLDPAAAFAVAKAASASSAPELWR